MTTENPVSNFASSKSPSNLEFALAAAEAAANTRCHNVVVMDLRGRSPVTEFFVIATGTSARQMRTVADEVSDLGKHLNFKAWQKSGYESARWILVDFVHVVVHVFDPDSRAFYDLEMLWGDAPRIDWRAELGLPPATPEELAPVATDGLAGLDEGGWEETPETDLAADAGHDDYLAESPT
ncbi:MAG: ribosome silencing factor, partial [Phycisphaerae bacterium]